MPTGYSGTPLAKKLGVKQGHTVALVGAPETWSIPDLDPGVKVRRDLRENPDVVIAFLRSRSELRRRRPHLLEALKAEGSLWLAWPRKAGGHVSDVTEQSLRDELLPTGLVDTKVAALDEDWSGLRFVWRREHRASIAQQGPKP
jgi:alkylation response protein AidB-like acyl-CoA dehydrogenase